MKLAIIKLLLSLALWALKMAHDRQMLMAGEARAVSKQLAIGIERAGLARDVTDAISNMSDEEVDAVIDDFFDKRK